MSESAIAKRKRARQRTKIRLRKKIFGVADRPRLSIFKSSKHIYAQIISDVDGRTLASASTLEEECRKQIPSIKKESSNNDSRSTKSVAAARAVGLLLAKRGLEVKLSKVVFDRNGYVFKGRIQAVADGVREGGLQV